jgi:hypothetical protein
MEPATASAKRGVNDEPEFSELFMADLLSRNSRIEEDLIDQLFNQARNSGADPSASGEFGQRSHG